MRYAVTLQKTIVVLIEADSAPEAADLALNDSGWPDADGDWANAEPTVHVVDEAP